MFKRKERVLGPVLFIILSNKILDINVDYVAIYFRVGLLKTLLKEKIKIDYINLLENSTRVEFLFRCRLS